jgi:hypothetical protein
MYSYSISLCGGETTWRRATAHLLIFLLCVSLMTHAWSLKKIQVRSQFVTPIKSCSQRSPGVDYDVVYRLVEVLPVVYEYTYCTGTCTYRYRGSTPSRRPQKKRGLSVFPLITNGNERSIGSLRPPSTAAAAAAKPNQERNRGHSRD